MLIEDIISRVAVGLLIFTVSLSNVLSKSESMDNLMSDAKYTTVISELNVRSLT